MYPPQTSLIPATVSLLRFFESNGFSAFIKDYPYWYLGSTPYRFLIGPVLPILSHFLRLTLRLNADSVSLFNITIYFVIVSFLLSAIGWTVLVIRISDIRYQGSKRKYLLLITYFLLLFLILPWKYLSGFALNEATLTISQNFIPFVLFFYWQYLSRKKFRWAVTAVLSNTVLLLINTSILPVLVIGLISLTLAYSYKKGKIRKPVISLKKIVLLLSYSLLLITIWYSPKYWITILFNPSIGGVSLTKALLKLFDLLKAFVPVALAFISVRLYKKVRGRLDVFIMVWMGTFLIITVFRFISDWDFWMDWTAWFSQLEVGVWLILLKKISDVGYRTSEVGRRKSELDETSNLKPVTYYLLLITLFLIPFYLTWRVYFALGKPQIFSKEIPDGVGSLKALNGIVEKNNGKANVFASGSTVFWLNAFYDMTQVRGGRDQVALHPVWDKASWEIREGNNSNKTLDWLNSLKIDYVLVHSDTSKEYYHDFKYLNKWETTGGVVWNSGGDSIRSNFTRN